MDVLYTTLPLDIVMENNEALEDSTLQNIKYEGIEMQVELMGWNKFKIIRLYTTDLNHYLDERFQPGSIISL